MSDDDDVVIIGFDKPEDKPSPVKTPQKVEETRKFTVKINDFEKRKESFLGNEVQIYHINIRSKNLNKECHRRFSDVQFLFYCLKQAFPGKILPGFPQNTVYTFVRAKLSFLEKQQFIGKRMQTIERFLQEILNDPVLFASEEVTNFIGPDNHFDIFKQSRQAMMAKKGIIGSALQTATNYFKTKKVDSKYQKILDIGLSASRQIEKLYQNIQSYFDLNKEELKMNASLHSQHLQLNRVPQTMNFLNEEDRMLENNNRELTSLLDRLYYAMLDIRVFIEIIQKRYELKELGELTKVEVLENTFEQQKDAFIERINGQHYQSKELFLKVIKERMAFINRSG